MALRRCFVCVEPDDETRNNISITAREIRMFGVPAQYVDPSQYHVNLEFLGEISDEGVERAENEWEKIVRAPFWAEAKGIDAFPDRGRPRVLFAGCFAEEFTALGRGKEEFHPHITIARVKALGEGNVAGIFGKFGEIPFGRFLVKEILLKESVLTPEGPIHKTIRRFPLKQW
jgi:RNA 2',3'-cyclic 3'-phosphodiesterase